jgi:hypothetical protein
VQDNGSLHKSRLVRQQWEQWQAQGLSHTNLNGIQGR